MSGPRIHAGALISAVNVSEVVAKLADGGLDERAIRETIGSLAVVIVPFDEDLAFRAGLLRPVTRSLGLSFGDRACIALGQRLELPAMTADRAWSSLNVGVTIRLVR